MNVKKAKKREISVAPHAPGSFRQGEVVYDPVAPWDALRSGMVSYHDDKWWVWLPPLDPPQDPLREPLDRERPVRTGMETHSGRRTSRSDPQAGGSDGLCQACRAIQVGRPAARPGRRPAPQRQAISQAPFFAYNARATPLPDKIACFYPY